MLTRRIACPSCEVTLKVPGTFPEGKGIKCPKCGAGFPVPGETGRSQSVKAAEARPRMVRGEFGPRAGGGPGAEAAAGDGANQDFAAGRKVFAQFCTRCHAIGGAGGGMGGFGKGKGMNSGPNLSTVGRDPTHTAD